MICRLGCLEYFSREDRQLSSCLKDSSCVEMSSAPAAAGPATGSATDPATVPVKKEKRGPSKVHSRHILHGAEENKGPFGFVTKVRQPNESTFVHAVNDKQADLTLREKNEFLANVTAAVMQLSEGANLSRKWPVFFVQYDEFPEHAFPHEKVRFWLSSEPNSEFTGTKSTKGSFKIYVEVTSWPRVTTVLAEGEQAQQTRLAKLAQQDQQAQIPKCPVDPMEPRQVAEVCRPLWRMFTSKAIEAKDAEETSAADACAQGLEVLSTQEAAVPAKSGNA